MTPRRGSCVFMWLMPCDFNTATVQMITVLAARHAIPLTPVNRACAQLQLTGHALAQVGAERLDLALQPLHQLRSARAQGVQHVDA